MATKRKIGKRRAEDYDSRRDEATNSNAPPDDFTLRPGAKVNLIRPSYNDGPMFMRPFPYLDYDSPETLLQPGRTSAEPGAYSPWKVTVRCASYIGLPECPRRTFILCHPRDRKTELPRNPWTIFAKASSNAFKSGKFGPSMKWDSDWNKFMKGSDGKGSAISFPKPLAFIQGAVYMNGDRFYLDGDRTKPLGLGKDDLLTVIQVKGSTGSSGGASEKLFGLLDERLDEFEGDETENPSVGFRWGDPVGKFLKNKRIVRGGAIVQIFNPKKTKPDIEKVCTSWDGKIADVQGYEVALYKQKKLGGEIYLPDLSTEDVDVLFERLQFWFDDDDNPSMPGLLYFPPVEEQALWIAQCFATAPKLVTFCWADNEEFMTDEVKAVLSKRVTSAVPKKSDDDDDDDNEDDDDKPKVKKDPTQSGKKKPAADDDDDDDDDDAPPKKSGKKKADDEDDDIAAGDTDSDEDDDAPPKKSSKKDKEEDEFEDDDAPPKKSGKKKADDEDDDDAKSDDDDDEDTPPSKRKPKADADDDDDEDTPPSKRKPKSDDDDDDVPPKKASKKKADEDDDDDPVAGGDDDDDDTPPKKSSKKKDDDDDDDDTPPKKSSKKTDDDDDDTPPKKSGKKKDEDYFGDDADDADAATKKSMKAGERAKDNSSKRGKTADAEPPKPKGGTATRKK